MDSVRHLVFLALLPIVQTPINNSRFSCQSTPHVSSPPNLTTPSSSCPDGAPRCSLLLRPDPVPTRPPPGNVKRTWISIYSVCGLGVCVCVWVSVCHITRPPPRLLLARYRRSNGRMFRLVVGTVIRSSVT